MDTLSKDVHYYALRITPYPNTKEKTLFCRERIGSFIETIGGINYLYGQEYEKNFHFHIVFSHPELFSTTKGEKIDDIKAKLYLIFEVPKKKEGNPTYSLEVVRELEEALCYAVKDNDYGSSEQWQEVVNDAYNNSYSKAHSLKRSLGDLTDAYMKNEINDRQLWVGLGQSRAELGLPLSIKWIEEMTLSIQCKKDPSKLQGIWEDLEIKRQLKSFQ